MKQFTHQFTASGIRFKVPYPANFVHIEMFKKETAAPLNELSKQELEEYAEAVKQSIIKKHKK